MKKPAAFSVTAESSPSASVRGPRAFSPQEVAALSTDVVPLTDPDPASETLAVPLRRMSWPTRLSWSTAGLLVSLALGLAADRLIRDLFEAYPALGWLGVAIGTVFVMALLALIVREAASLWRLRALDRLKAAAAAALVTDSIRQAKAVTRNLTEIYAARPDCARALAQFNSGESQVYDGADLIRFAERSLMSPLDARARALAAASARRVALVTAVSPRALVDIAFVIWESIRLSSAIARLYGARPGLFGTWRLIGAVLSHLAVTGGLVLTDGVIEQLVGQGLAGRLSQRLGEGVVNGLMTVRVGIAAMRVVRPLPFDTEPQPRVKDFLPEVTKVLQTSKNS
ncbi:MAG: TIGR01620 family protein [Devosia sp.]